MTTSEEHARGAAVGSGLGEGAAACGSDAAPVFARRVATAPTGGPVFAYPGPDWRLDRRETKVVALMYATASTLVALGVQPDVALAAATAAGTAAARLLGLI
jgi:hypothetical protein